MYTIVNPEVEASLSEMTQSLPVKFAYCKVEEGSVIKRQMEWAKCRDFLGDVVWSNAYKRPIGIYGFNGSHDRIPLPEGDFTLLMKFPSTASQNAFLKNYHQIVRYTEILNGFSQTSAIKVAPKTVLVTCPAFWKTSVPAMSFYSFLLKASCHKYVDVLDWVNELRTKGVTESSYCQVDINKVIRKASAVFSDLSITGWANDGPDMNGSTVHNSSGFFSLFRIHQHTNSFSNTFFGA